MKQISWITRLAHSKGLPLPSYAHDGDAGLDLRAAVEEGKEFSIAHNEIVKISTGFKIAIPKGYVGLLCPRSGLGIYHGVTPPNSPGVIDSGFTGECIVALHNHSIHPFKYKRGDRIAQLVVVPFATITWMEVKNLGDTERGEAGFGSSGI